MLDAITGFPSRLKSRAICATLFKFSLRSSEEKPKPLLIPALTTSPSRCTVLYPLLSSSSLSAAASVVFPEHGRPVNHIVRNTLVPFFLTCHPTVKLSRQVILREE